MRFSLQQLELIDAPVEVEYDNLTSLAAQLLQVPVVHVSILDKSTQRVFYKSQHGHPHDLANSRELPMELTYCQHVPLTQEPLIVVDASQHDLLKGTAAQENGPLAYLGLPIHTPDGQTVGGLCMMQPEVRHWTDSEIESAKKLAACVTDLIRLKAAMLISERLRQEQREFTYAISHDMMSPANTLHMILDEIVIEQDKLTPDVQELVHRGLETVGRMGQQVEDVLQYSRTIDLYAVSEELSLNTLLEDTLHDFKSSIIEANATINCKGLPTIIGNRMQFRALFQNLIGNALKFRHVDRDPVVEISAWFNEATNEDIIGISDNGIGIARRDYERIFCLFSRLHLQEQFAGSGIGLALCQRVAENHGGCISVTSDGQSGSTFTTNIPRHRL